MVFAPRRMLWVMDVEHGPPLDWPPPPPFTHYVMENPWPLAACLFTAAVALLLIGYRRGGAPPRIVAGVIGIATIGFIALSMVIKTDREVMADRTRALVNAAVLPVDIDTFRETLSRESRFFGRDYEQILSTIQTATDHWRVKQAFITNLLARRDGDTRGRTYLSVITRIDTSIGGGSAQTRWLLHWQKEPDGAWRVTRIDWLSLNDRDASEGDLP